MSTSVAGCFPAVMNSRKSEGLFSLVEKPTWLCETAQLTTSSYSTLSRSVTTSMSFPALLPLESWYRPLLCLVVLILCEVSVCVRPKSSNGTTVGKFTLFNHLRGHFMFLPFFCCLPHYALLYWCTLHF